MKLDELQSSELSIQVNMISSLMYIALLKACCFIILFTLAFDIVTDFLKHMCCQCLSRLNILSKWKGKISLAEWLQRLIIFLLLFYTTIYCSLQRLFSFQFLFDEWTGFEGICLRWVYNMLSCVFVTMQHLEKRMEQEKELLQNQNTWLNSELKSKTDELFTVTKEKGKEILQLRCSLESKTDEVNYLCLTHHISASHFIASVII